MDHGAPPAGAPPVAKNTPFLQWVASGMVRRFFHFIA